MLTHLAQCRGLLVARWPLEFELRFCEVCASEAVARDTSRARHFNLLGAQGHLAHIHWSDLR